MRRDHGIEGTMARGTDNSEWMKEAGSIKEFIRFPNALSPATTLQIWQHEIHTAHETHTAVVRILSCLATFRDSAGADSGKCRSTALGNMSLECVTNCKVCICECVYSIFQTCSCEWENSTTFTPTFAWLLHPEKHGRVNELIVTPPSQGLPQQQQVPFVFTFLILVTTVPASPDTLAGKRLRFKHLTQTYYTTLQTTMYLSNWETNRISQQSILSVIYSMWNLRLLQEVTWPITMQHLSQKEGKRLLWSEVGGFSKNSCFFLTQLIFFFTW